MMALAIIGWLCTVVILGGYFVASVVERPNVFHAVNVITFVPLAAANAVAGAWWAVLLNVAFGLIASYALWRNEYDLPVEECPPS